MAALPVAEEDEAAAAAAADVAAKKEEADDVEDLALDGRGGGSLVPLAVAVVDAEPALASGCGLANSESDEALEVGALSRRLK